MPSSSSSNQFTTNDKSDNRGNSTIAIIKGLFLNIRYRLLQKKLIMKVIQEIYVIFIHSAKHIKLNNQIVLYNFKLGLRLFQAFRFLLYYKLK